MKPIAAMNSSFAQTPAVNGTVPTRIEFFRLPAPGKRDPYFGLSRAWFYKAESLGEIRMISVRQRNAIRGVRLVVYDTVTDYIRRAAEIDDGLREERPQR